MPYRLKRKETVRDGVRRIGGEQLEAAIASLEEATTPTQRSKAVHDVRKRLKKLRALLKLVRPALGDEPYHAENEAARQTGRLLAAARDADARVEVFDAFVRDGHVEGRRADARAIRAELLDARRQARTSLAGSDVVSEVLERLRAARERVNDWPLPDDDWATIEGGLRRACKKADRAFRAALDDPTPERLHEWRKRTKDLRYHVRLLRRTWPAVLEAQLDELQRLSTLLGDDHDLVVLGTPLARTAPLADADTLQRWHEAIASRRRALLTKAEPLGHRLFAEKASRVTARIETYWTTWRRRSDATLAAKVG